MRINLIAILEIDAKDEVKGPDDFEIVGFEPLAIASNPGAAAPSMEQLAAMLTHAAKEDGTLLRTLTGPVAKAH